MVEQTRYQNGTIQTAKAHIIGMLSPHVAMTFSFHFSFRGWEQLEMTCNPVQKHENSKWNVESHVNERSMDLLAI